MTSICRKYRKAERKPEYSPDVPVKIPVERKEKLNIIFLPGHQPNGGTRTYQPHIEESEWNRELVARIESTYEGKHTLVRGCEWRKEKSYSAYTKRVKSFCKNNDVDLVIEIHLNAAGIPEARGCEMLIAPYDATATLAYNLISQFSLKFKIVPRGWYKSFQGVKARKSGDRGGYLMNEIEKVGTMCMLFEPFFADYRSKDSEQFLEMPDYGVEKMAKYFREALSYL